MPAVVSRVRATGAALAATRDGGSLADDSPFAFGADNDHIDHNEIISSLKGPTLTVPAPAALGLAVYQSRRD